MAALTVTDATLQAEVLQASLPVLIDFWAPWCAPCRAISRLVDELAEAYAGRLKVVKIDADENTGAATRFGVRAVPNLVFVKDGQVAEQILGALPKGRLVQAVERVLVA